MTVAALSGRHRSFMNDFGLPPVVGDPAGMRALAARVRGQARQVEGVQTSVGGTVNGMTFKGPAARDFTAKANDWRGQAQDVAGELEAIAALLERTAGKVEREQRERAKTIERLQRAEDERRREAQRNRL